jgi:hypothetical protein
VSLCGFATWHLYVLFFHSSLASTYNNTMLLVYFALLSFASAQFYVLYNDFVDVCGSDVDGSGSYNKQCCDKYWSLSSDDRTSVMSIFEQRYSVDTNTFCDCTVHGGPGLNEHGCCGSNTKDCFGECGDGSNREGCVLLDICGAYATPGGEYPLECCDKYWTMDDVQRHRALLIYSLQYQIDLDTFCDCTLSKGPGLNQNGCCGNATKDCAGTCGGSLRYDCERECGGSKTYDTSGVCRS